MKNKVQTLKAAVAIIFAGINSKNKEEGINATYKYKSEPVDEKDFKGWVFSVSIAQLGHKERMLQTLRFKRPDNIDKYNMEYNVLMSVLSSGMETALLTWNEIGKTLNVDPQLQKKAREVIKE